MRSACLLVLLVLVVGCRSIDHWYFKKHDHEHPAEWSYEGDTGPAHWGDLSPEYEAAKNGRGQSPINIVKVEAKATDLPIPEIDYKEEKVVFLNNGHTLEHVEGEGSWLEWKGKRYKLAQYHFHTPSEHTIDGRHSPMEMHFVHKGSGGKVLVLAAMVNEGGRNKGLEEASRHLPGKKGTEATVMPNVNLAHCLPKDHRCYHYAGSFTTPPCTEGVIWLVLERPITAPAVVLERFRQAMGTNIRPTQPLYDRTVEAGR